MTAHNLSILEDFLNERATNTCPRSSTSPPPLPLHCYTPKVPDHRTCGHPLHIPPKSDHLPFGLLGPSAQSLPTKQWSSRGHTTRDVHAPTGPYRQGSPTHVIISTSQVMEHQMRSSRPPACNSVGRGLIMSPKAKRCAHPPKNVDEVDN